LLLRLALLTALTFLSLPLLRLIISRATLFWIFLGLLITIAPAPLCICSRTCTEQDRRTDD
jgi:hypothetical protein